MKNTLDQNELLRYEQIYKEAGMDVGPCDPTQKRPMYKWKDVSARRTMTVERNIQQFGLQNTGICIFTGKVSGITVIDVDNREAKLSLMRQRASLEKDQKERDKIGLIIFEAEKSKADYEQAIETMMRECTHIATTQSGGYHFYFKYSPRLVNKANYIPFIDVRNDGGLIVAPPTVSTVGEYKWIKGEWA